jgi:PPM family protein phosphatase
MVHHLLNIAMGVHRGLRRESNEDAIAYRYPSNYDVLLKRGVLVALADGVATSGRGADASQTAVTRLIDTYYTQPDYVDCKQALVASVRQINAEIHRLYQQGSTTLVAAVIHEAHVIIAHVGDSRAYWLHNDMLEQVTEDHVVFKKKADGTIKSNLTRAIGHHSSVEIDVNEMNIYQDDAILLVSDGVTRYFGELELLGFLQHPPTKSVREMIHASNQAGGIDNIGTIVVQIGAELTGHVELTNHLTNIRPQIIVNVPEGLPEKNGQSRKFPLPFDKLQQDTTQPNKYIISKRMIWISIALLIGVVALILVYNIFQLVTG